MCTMESDLHLDQKFQAPLAQLPIPGLDLWSWNTDLSKAATHICYMTTQVKYFPSLP